MDKLSIIQRILIVQHCPSPYCIRLIVAKFKAFGTVADRRHPGRFRTVRNIDNIESTRRDVAHNSQKSVRGRSKELQISKTSLCLILKENFKCYLYEIQLVLKVG